MTTTNKGLNEPAANSPNWNVPNNENFGFIDAALGGSTTKSATGVGTTPVVLTLVEYRNLSLTITGTLTANVTYQIPAGVGGQWIVANNTTGSYTLTISSGGGGASVVIPTGGRRTVYSDGTNIYGADNATAAIGSSGTIVYNNGAGLTGSTDLLYDGSKVTVTVTSAATSVGVEGFRINAQSSGTPAAGFGPMIALEGETSPGVTKVGGQITAAISDISVGSEDFDFVFNLMAAGTTAAEKMRLKSTGELVPSTAVWTTDVKGKTGGNDANVNGITIALASQAEAEAGTDNTKLMTPLRTSQAITALTRTSIAGYEAGSIGSYGFFNWTTGGTSTSAPGATTAGSNLQYSSLNSGGSYAGASPSGTWRLMGYGNRNSVWLRIA